MIFILILQETHAQVGAVIMILVHTIVSVHLHVSQREIAVQIIMTFVVRLNLSKMNTVSLSLPFLFFFFFFFFFCFVLFQGICVNRLLQGRALVAAFLFLGT